jgi:hypothetical protein
MLDPGPQPIALHDSATHLVMRAGFGLIVLFSLLALGLVGQSAVSGGARVADLPFAGIFLVMLVLGWLRLGRASRVYLRGDTVEVTCWRKYSFALRLVRRLEHASWLGSHAKPRRLILADGRRVLFYATDGADRLLAARGVARSP